VGFLKAHPHEGPHEPRPANLMGEGAKKLLHEALGLPREERAELAAELIASLDGPADPDAEQAWAAEIERRAARVLTGEGQGTPWEEVRRRIEGEISGR